MASVMSIDIKLLLTYCPQWPHSSTVLYHAMTKTGFRADLARREAELNAKKEAHGMSCSFAYPRDARNFP